MTGLDVLVLGERTVALYDSSRSQLFPSALFFNATHSEAPKMSKSLSVLRAGLRSPAITLAIALALTATVTASGATPARKHADTASSTPTIAEKTKDAQKLPGYFNLYWDAKSGKLWLEIDKWNTEFLYQTSLPAGIGSNDIGLDRGQMGETRIVRFERTGPKILLIQSNLEYRAVTSDPDERAAVRDSFAESALWGFTMTAEEGSGDGAHVLVDATEFFLR